MRGLQAQPANHLGHLKEMGVDCLLDSSHPGLLAEVVCPQQAEVVVRVAVVQCQDEVYQRLSAAHAHQELCQAPQGISNTVSPAIFIGPSLRMHMECASRA